MDWNDFPLPAEVPPRGSCVRLERPEPGLVVLTLDPPHRARTVLDVPLWRDLEVALGGIDPEAGDRGLVLRGREPLHFAYGADVDAIETVSDPELVRSLTLAVHRVLNRLERLGRERGFESVAAVGGPVPGGALELSLACNTILAADDPSTRLGLPETQLGILPGWGGCHRLTRKIGVPQALQAILTGRLVDARRAARMGIVDRLTPPEYLERVARDLALGRASARPRKRSFAGRWLVDRNPLAGMVIERQAQKQSRARTHGHYPAIEAVIPIVVRGARTGRKQAAQREAQAVARLATGPVAKHLVAIFKGSEAAKQLARDEAGEAEARPERGFVIGAGVMGGAIASSLAERGIATRLTDLSPEAVDVALVEHRLGVEKRRRRRRLKPHEARAALDRLDPAPGLTGIARAEVVIEAVAERLEVKRELFARVAAEVSQDALLATNTSSLSVTAVAEGIPHPERVVGVHFFNPVKRMPLVEIVPGRDTSDHTVRRAAALVLALGKTPVVVADVRGFLVNRLLGPYLDEALRLVEAGVEPERLDRSLVDFGMPLGPLRLLDEVGFDIADHAARSLFEAYGERMRPCDLLGAWIDAGRLGKKSGRGFYDWSQPKKPRLATDLERLASSTELAGLSDEKLVKRCVLAMVNEAARCLEEGVVASPAELDLASVFGIGFAPFRGGIWSYAESLSPEGVTAELEALAGSPDLARRPGAKERFEPCARWAS